VDVDTASYTNVRRMIQSGKVVPKDAVRIEEMINYFAYDYPQPEGKHPFSVNVETASCPWNEKHRLVKVGLKGKDIIREKRPATNLVFLLDVSGSMALRALR
jgi:Ca-activated chloride channel family protein